jgi:hypothetical protein
MLQSLGVPPVLLTGGNNNANIDVAVRMFFISTVLPLVERACSAMSLLVNKNKDFFKLREADTYYLRPDTRSIPAMKEDTISLASSTQGLYSVGIITKNEARIKNNYPEDSSPEANTYLTPQNIAGSAINPATGGRPKEDEKS